MAQMTLTLGADYSSAAREAGKVVRGLKDVEKTGGDVAKSAKAAGDAMEKANKRGADSAQKAFREFVAMEREIDRVAAKAHQMEKVFNRLERGNQNREAFAPFKAFAEGAKDGAKAADAMNEKNRETVRSMNMATVATGTATAAARGMAGALGGVLGPLLSLAAAWRIVNDMLRENDELSRNAAAALNNALPAMKALNLASGGNAKVNAADRAKAFGIADTTGISATIATSIVGKAREEGVPQAAEAYARGELAGIPGVGALEAFGKAKANFPDLGPQTFLNLAIAQQQKTGAPVEQVMSGIEALGPAARDAGISLPALLMMTGKFTEGTTKKAAVGTIRGILETYAAGAMNERGEANAGFAAAAAEVRAAEVGGRSMLPDAIDGAPLRRLYAGAIATPEIAAAAEQNRQTARKERAESARAMNRVRRDASQAELDAAQEAAGVSTAGRWAGSVYRATLEGYRNLFYGDGDAYRAAANQQAAAQLRDGARANSGGRLWRESVGQVLGGDDPMMNSLRLLVDFSRRGAEAAERSQRENFRTLTNGPGSPGER